MVQKTEPVQTYKFCVFFLFSREINYVFMRLNAKFVEEKDAGAIAYFTNDKSPCKYTTGIRIEQESQRIRQKAIHTRYL